MSSWCAKPEEKSVSKMPRNFGEPGEHRREEPDLRAPSPNSRETAADRAHLFFKAFKTSIPVLTGYLAIGIAFGLLVADSGYPFWLSPLMGVITFTGAGQFMAIGLFVGGVGLFELLAIELALAVRHIAYGFSLYSRFAGTGIFKPYLIYALTDETFALLTNAQTDSMTPQTRSRYLFYIAALDQSYWVAGSLIGAVAGTLIPVSMEGVSFSLTALFIVLAIEQIFPLLHKLKKVP
jgi:4-azaleucine resistance transporter AzlC